MVMIDTDNYKSRLEAEIRTTRESLARLDEQRAALVRELQALLGAANLLLAAEADVKLNAAAAPAADNTPAPTDAPVE